MPQANRIDPDEQAFLDHEEKLSQAESEKPYIKPSTPVTIIVAALVGLCVIAGAVLAVRPEAGAYAESLPMSYPCAAVAAAGGLIMLMTLFFLKRRPGDWVRTLIGLGLTLVGLALAANMTLVGFGWRLIPVGARDIDLTGAGVTDITPIRRMTQLRIARLGDNAITDISPLSGLENLEYVDLTGNPLSDENGVPVRRALPDCLILAPVTDDQTVALSLGGHALPRLGGLEEALRACTALETVDLRGALLQMGEIEALEKAFPNVRFLTSTLSGDTLAGEGMALIEVESVEDAYGQVVHYAGLRRITVTGANFTPDEYYQLQALCPDTRIDCQLIIYGLYWPTTAQYVDLSKCAVDERLEEYLGLFPALSELRLPDTDPREALALSASLDLSALQYRIGDNTINASTDEVDLRGRGVPEEDYLLALRQTAPALRRLYVDPLSEDQRAAYDRLETKIEFVYDIDVLGVTVSTDAATLDMGERIVSDDEVPQIERAMAYLPNLTRIDMFESRLSSETMDRLFDTYPDIFWGWTFDLCGGKWTVRTDITAFSTLQGENSKRWDSTYFVPLRYCKNLMALDLGHNQVQGINFLRNFPHLRILILADNQVTDISVLSELKELEYVELFLNYISSFEPLAGHDNLKDLNLCYCLAHEGRNDRALQPLKSCPNLERLWVIGDWVTDEMQDDIRAALPNCTFHFGKSGGSTNFGWRNHDRYYIIRQIFRSREYVPFDQPAADE